RGFPIQASLGGWLERNSLVSRPVFLPSSPRSAPAWGPVMSQAGNGNPPPKPSFEEAVRSLQEELGFKGSTFDWAAWINAKWDEMEATRHEGEARETEKAMEVGLALFAARDEMRDRHLPDDDNNPGVHQWTKMCRKRLKFSKGWVSKLMAIAESERIQALSP